MSGISITQPFSSYSDLATSWQNAGVTAGLSPVSVPTLSALESPENTTAFAHDFSSPSLWSPEHASAIATSAPVANLTAHPAVISATILSGHAYAGESAMAEIGISATEVSPIVMAIGTFAIIGIVLA